METTRRVKAVCVSDTLPFFSLPYLAECNSEAPCPLVCLESEAVVLEEPAPDASRIELRSTQIGVSPPMCRISIDAHEEVFYP